MEQNAAAPTDASFFARARGRLTLDVPAALDDLTATAVRGDLDLDDELWKKAGVQATRPAAVLVPLVFLTLAMGVGSSYFTRTIEPAVERLVVERPNPVFDAAPAQAAAPAPISAPAAPAEAH